MVDETVGDGAVKNASLPGSSAVKPNGADRPAWDLSGVGPYIFGIVALFLYVVAVFAMLNQLGKSDVTEIVWTRMLYVFTGVETIAFSAAGFFFGREVNRGRAVEAEKRAEAETQRAASAQKEAANAQVKGKVLAQKIRNLADMDSPPAGQAIQEGTRSTATPLRQLAREAEQLFPIA